MNNTSSLTKILNGINSTLNIVNKAMPIYKEAKPILNTMKNTYSTIKNNNGDFKKIINLLKLKNQIKKDSKKNLDITNTNVQKNITQTSYNNINNPKFFI